MRERLELRRSKASLTAYLCRQPLRDGGCREPKPSFKRRPRLVTGIPLELWDTAKPQAEHRGRYWPPDAPGTIGVNLDQNQASGVSAQSDPASPWVSRCPVLSRAPTPARQYQRVLDALAATPRDRRGHGHRAAGFTVYFSVNAQAHQRAPGDSGSRTWPQSAKQNFESSHFAGKPFPRA